MLTLLALLASPTADARAFSTADLPHTEIFTFDWSVADAQGTTSYVFETATRFTGSLLCEEVPGCMDGIFSTGNGGDGVFSTRVRVVDGDFVGECSGTYVLFGTETFTCNIEQTLELTYAITSSVYDGTASCGSLTTDVTFFFGFPVELSNSDYSGLVPGDFSGTMTSPTGASGTFSE